LGTVNLFSENVYKCKISPLTLGKLTDPEPQLEWCVLTYVAMLDLHLNSC